MKFISNLKAKITEIWNLAKNKAKQIKREPENTAVKWYDYVLYLVRFAVTFIFGLVGAFSWVLTSLVAVLSVSLVVGASIGLLTYKELKPQIEEAREKAYDTLQDMKSSDFSMLEDTEVYDTNGDLIGIVNAGHYEYAEISDISLNLQNAYIAQEDRRFKEHNGVDWISTIRAGLALIKHNGEITQGGSTITQQVIKNTYLTQEQTFNRKFIEIMLAPQVEQEFSKADIMEFYCNTNFYGNRCYGVQAASRYYFGKDASELEVWEAATLAGISNSPTAYNPVKNPEASTEKRNDILKSMYEVGFIREKEYYEAIKMPLSVVQETQEGTNENYQMSYAIHCAALELMKLEGFEFKYTYKDKDEYTTYTELYSEVYGDASDRIRAGGYKIYTSLDPEIQQMAQDSLDSILSGFSQKQENGKYALQGASAVVDNTTNYVVAVIGGRGTEDQFNRAYLSARQPGSSIKPLLDYGPAFDTGEYYPSKVMNDHKWEGGPDNSGGGFRGHITIREALNRSINTIAWQLLQSVGVNNGLEYLDKMHFNKLSYIDNGVEALSLGGFTNGVRVVDMAKGYSTLANSGVYSDRTCIVSMDFKSEKDILGSLREWSEQVYSIDTAYMLTDVLKGTTAVPWGTGYGLGLNNGHISAGKTGTTNNNKDAWYCGYTKYYSVAVWMGYDEPKAMPGVYGATYAGRIWQSTMNKLHQGLEVADWAMPETVGIAPYEPSTGAKSVHETGLNDLFSITAEQTAAQLQYEREQKALADRIEPYVEQYEAFNISSIAETYKIAEQYKEVTDKISVIEEDTLRNPLMERASNKYNELCDIVDGMASAIKEYEDAIQREKDQQAELERATAELQRQTEELEAIEKGFKNALQKIIDLEYRPNEASLDSLLDEARSALSLTVTSPNYDTYYTELEEAIIALDSLPDEETWKLMEQKRIAEEAEAARLKAEEEAKKAAERDQQLQNLIDNRKPGWSSNNPASPDYENSGNGSYGTGPDTLTNNSGNSSNGPGVPNAPTEVPTHPGGAGTSQY